MDDRALDGSVSLPLERNLDRANGEVRLDGSTRATPVLRERWLAFGAVAVLFGLVLRSAWVSDDAYITLRTIDNWVRGFGLRWNVGERVQSFTHPLWMLLLSPVYALLRHGFASTLLVALLTTVGALVALVRLARSGGHALVAVVLLALSRGFVDFSTSGLENPLTHLLIALFVGSYAVREASLHQQALIAGLLALSRADALLVVLPALAHSSALDRAQHGARHTGRALAVGLSPLIAWELFSLFYYGSLVPNTAYAKLNTGIPRAEAALQGLVYLIQSLSWDPALFVAAGLGVALGMRGRRRHEQLLALGVVLYLLYLLWIGGDFMLGRFLTLPLFLAVCIIAVSRAPFERPALVLSTLLPFGLLLLHPNATERYVAGEFLYSGIADERAFYRESSSLMMYARGHSVPNYHWVADGLAARARGDKVLVHANVGFLGYYAGPTVHIIDFFALADPLLARLPAAANPTWRVGHFARHLPPGYVQTVQTGSCVMQDRNLCEYYQALREVVAGDLFSWRRLVTLVKLQLGAYDSLIDRERYRYLTQQYAALSNLTARVDEGAAWDGAGTRKLTNDGIQIDLGRAYHSKQVAFSLDGNDAYRVELRDDAEVVQELRVPAFGLPGMHSRGIRVSPEARRRGFDTIVIRPAGGDGNYSVGYLRLTE